jgi:AcrR family transcriptional regulator
LPSAQLREPRRRLPREQRRRELLDAAVRVLRERGPTHCRVQDITSAAGTAKGNFYRYFPTWDDLLIAVRDHLRANYAVEVERRVTGRDAVDWWSALEQEANLFIDFQLGLGGLHDAVFHGPAGRARPIDDERSAATIIEAFVAAGIEHGAFSPVAVGPIAVLIFHVLHGAADEIAAGKDDAAIRAAALHIIKRALEPREDTP